MRQVGCKAHVVHDGEESPRVEGGLATLQWRRW